MPISITGTHCSCHGCFSSVIAMTRVNQMFASLRNLHHLRSNAKSQLSAKQCQVSVKSAIIHRSLPTTGEIIGTSRITRLFDKGEGKGAVALATR